MGMAKLLNSKNMENFLVWPNLWIAFQTGHWMNGFAMVAKLICQDIVDEVHSGPKAWKNPLIDKWKLSLIESSSVYTIK